VVAVLTVARGLDITIDPSITHKVINAIDDEDYNIQKDFDEGCLFISEHLNHGSVLGTAP
jgi:hypothetical protein